MARTRLGEFEILLAELRGAEHTALREIVLRHVDRREGSELAALLTRLKDVSEQHLITDARLALALADALIDAAELTEQPAHRALGLLARADALRVQGSYHEAARTYEQAGDLAVAREDSVTWARTRTGWVLCMHYLGRGREALAVIDQAEAVLIQGNEWLRAGGLNLNAGLICYELGDYARSLELYERALGHYDQAQRDRPDLAQLADERSARARANMALGEAMLGNFSKAIALYAQARGIFSSHGEDAAALRVDHYVAELYAGQGHYTRALRVHADALVAAERAGLADTVVEVGLAMVRAYAGLNRHADALRVAEQLVERCERSGSPTEAAKARFAGAQSLAALGRSDDALKALDAAATVFGQSGLQAELARVSLLRARIYLNDRDWRAAATAAEHARGLLRRGGALLPLVQAELAHARADLEQSHLDLAAQDASKALELADERGLLPLTHEAHHLLARTEHARGNIAGAGREYADAVADLERVQSRLVAELRVDFLGDKLEVFFDAIDCALATNDAETAFGYLERAKSRALVDYLLSSPEVQVGARTEREQRLIDELAELRDEHHWYVSRLHGLTSTDSASSNEIECAALQSAVEDRERRISGLVERLALLRSAEALEPLAPWPIADSQVPPVEEGTVLLEYLLRPGDGAVFVVTSSGVYVEPLPVGATEVHKLLRRWQLNLDGVGRALASGQSVDALAPNARGILHALYRALVAPVADALRQTHAERLIVVPFGPAHAVPFQALFDGTHYLTEYLEVSIAPSSAVLDLCRRRPSHHGRGALVLGHTSNGQLPAVIDEARTVGDLLGTTAWLEDDATRARFVDAAPSHGILHLAAHGQARLDNPLFAHIALADGQLSMQDVFNLRLDGALVTLSACETGRSAVVGGDELVGLSRGFLFAGAATLVQSLWRVDDAATAQLMTRFYTGVRDGRSPGAALREAQCAMLAEGTHPHSWGAFQLVGRDGTM